MPVVRRPLALLLLVLAGWVLAACAGGEAPAEEPGSGRPGTAAGAATPSSSAPASPTGSSSPPRPRTPPTPSLTVPDLPTLVDRGEVEGADVSWPQCPPGMGIPQKRSLGAPMPFDTAEFVVIGLTNGPSFHPNPCLADQVAWARERGLMIGVYSVLSHPEERFVRAYADQGPYDASTAHGRLGNLGYQQALFNLRTMRQAGVQTPAVWVDVEPVPSFDWPADPEGNAAIVRGAVRAYQEAGYLVGAYSTQYLWSSVVGDLRLGLPEWRAAGQTSRAEARRRCGPGSMFQGGAAVLSQWVEADRDRNITCPGESSQLELWFALP